MTEIRIDVDLSHPLERVWKALTDPQVLRQWFMAVEIEGDPPRRVVMLSSGVAGFDEQVEGELVEIKSQERLVMRWRGSQLHTSATILLEPIAVGCRLTFVQRGFLGPQGTLRRRVLRRTYQEMTGPRLQRALEWLAESERERVNLIRRQAGGPGAGGSRDPRRNDAKFLSTVSSKALAGLLRAGRNMALLRSPDAARSPRGPSVRGVAMPAGEPLREIPTTPMARKFWPRRLRGRGRAAAAPPPPRRGQPGLSPRDGLAGPGGRVPTGRPAGRPDRSGRDDSRWQRREGEAAVPRSPVANGAAIAILVLMTTLAVLLDGVTQPGGFPARAGLAKRAAGSGAAPRRTDTTSKNTGVVPSPLAPTNGAARPPSVTLTAAYRTERHVVGGYEAVVTINNLSTQPVDGWLIRMVLPPFGLVVRTVEGARAEQTDTDKEIQFKPSQGTRVIPAGKAVRFKFQVQGVGAPIECEINDQPCTGVPERPTGTN